MNQDYIQKLYSEYTSQRNAMHDASLEAAGRYDRAVLSITTGALAVSIAFLDKRERNWENVEWSGDGLLKDRFRNFLKDNRSLIWFSSSRLDHPDLTDQCA